MQRFMINLTANWNFTWNELGVCLNEREGEKNLFYYSIIFFRQVYLDGKYGKEILGSGVIDAASIRVHTYASIHVQCMQLLRYETSVKRISQVSWINKEAWLMYFNRRSIFVGSVPDSSSSGTKEFRHMTLNRHIYHQNEFGRSTPWPFELHFSPSNTYLLIYDVYRSWLLA